MKLFVIPNPTKEGTAACFQELIQVCDTLSFSVFLERKFQRIYGGKTVHYGEFTDLLDLCDFVVVIGGDGTILHAAKAILQKMKLGAEENGTFHYQPKPLIGINTGRLGFPSSLEVGELGAFGKLITGGYTIEQRMLLAVELFHEEKREVHYALNDAAVSRGDGSGIVDIHVQCQGRYVATYTADGIIFATPSGSTAYSLSAGGPIVDPGLACIEVTPVCAHSLFSRPMIFSGQQQLEVSVSQSRERWAFLTVDGEESVRLDERMRIQIKTAPFCARFVNLTGKTFYEVLNKKIISKNL